MIICSNCKKELPDDARFCDECGSAVTATEQVEMESASEQVINEKPKKKKKGLKITLIIIAAVLLAAAIGGGIWYFFFKNKKAPSYVFYVKKGEMYYSDFKMKEPLRLTDDFGESENFYESSLNPIISKDGKRVVYPDKIKEDEDAVTLYTRDVTKPEEEPVKIGDDISFCRMSEDGKYLVYITDEQAGLELYFYDIKKDESEKIAKDVNNIHISSDFKKIIFFEINGDDKYDMYVKEFGEDKQKIASDFKNQYISEDLSLIFYIDSKNDLYKIEDNYKPTKISENVKRIIEVSDSGEMYYVKKGTEVSLYDYIEDDMKASDESVIIPELPVYPEYSAYDDYSLYRAAVDAYYIQKAAYDLAVGQAADIGERNLKRQKLIDEKIEINNPLCYYDGKQEKVVSESYYLYGEIISEDVFAIEFIENITDGNVQKLLFSEYKDKDIDDIGGEVGRIISQNTKEVVAVKGQRSEIEFENIRGISLSPDAKSVYVLGDVYEGEVVTTNLYKGEITPGNPIKPELYDTDVSDDASTDIWVYGNGDVAYFKNYIYERDEEGKVIRKEGDLYINKKLVCEKVSETYNATYFESAGLYLIESDIDSDICTLYSYKNGKKEKLGDDVYSYNYYVTEQGNVIFISSYDTWDMVGKLRYYKDGEVEKIAEDVNAFNYLPGGEIVYLYDYDIDDEYGKLAMNKNGKVTEIDEKVESIFPYYEDRFIRYYW